MFNFNKEKKWDKKDKKDKKDKNGRRKLFAQQTRRFCRFCSDSKLKIDYKNEKLIHLFISERGKIINRKYTGACAKHQRDVTLAVKRARILGLVPYTSTQVRV